MENNFKPIAMRCNNEQFKKIQNKLDNCKVDDVGNFKIYNYLTNYAGGESNYISNITEGSLFTHYREIHHEWNEEVFLRACGIEIETLEEQECRLMKELIDVQFKIKEIKQTKLIKEGDWIFTAEPYNFKRALKSLINHYNEYGCYFKVTNPELIKLLNSESEKLKKSNNEKV